MVNNLLILTESSYIHNLVRSAFPKSNVEVEPVSKKCLQRMQSLPSVEVLILDITAFKNDRVAAESIKSFQSIYPKIPIVVINRDVVKSELDSSYLIHSGAQDIINIPTCVDVVRTAIIRSIARHAVRQDFAPLESQMEEIKSDVDRCETYNRQCDDTMKNRRVVYKNSFLGT